MHIVTVKDRMGQHVVSIPQELRDSDYAIGDRLVVLRLADGSLLLRPVTAVEPAMRAALGIPA